MTITAYKYKKNYQDVSQYNNDSYTIYFKKDFLSFAL